ncbi:unnamed protein product [Prunus brigantina]
MEKIRDLSGEAYKWLEDRHASHWSRSHFKTGGIICAQEGHNATNCGRNDRERQTSNSQRPRQVGNRRGRRLREAVNRQDAPTEPACRGRGTSTAGMRGRDTAPNVGLRGRCTTPTIRMGGRSSVPTVQVGGTNRQPNAT